MTVMPRPATLQELVKLRAVQQRSQLYLTVQPAVTVYQAQLAALPTSNDRVVSITYTAGSGTYTNIIQDQTVLVGSTPGAFDLGVTRVRNTTGLGATSGTLNIGQTSNINWQTTSYLTILDEFQIWRRDPRVLDDGSGTILMDWDIAYSDQHTHCLSVPVLGPPAVKWLFGSSVTVRFDASQSWCVNNTITSYSWSAPGASATTGLTTANPTMTYNALGMYRVSCTITNSDGVSYTGYRYVFVINNTSAPPYLITQFTLDSLLGDFNTGSWSAQVTLAAQADLTIIRDRALAILHTRDWYGPSANDEGSVGYVDDRENIALVGWVSLENDLMGMTGRWNTTTFTIEGPGWMLGKPTSYPVTLKDKTIAPVKWTRFQGVTARAMMWHIFMWRTTCMRSMDVFPMNNSWRAARLDAAGGLSLWNQVNTVLGNHYNASACSDRYGRIHLQQQQNTLDASTRSGLPTVFNLTRDDWANSITFERRQIEDVGYVNFSGVAWDGTKPTAFFSLAPGHTPTQFGISDVAERLVLDNNQAGVNSYAAAYRGWKNNPLPKFPFTMPMNNRMIDIAPYQYITNTFLAGDTARNFTDVSHRFIPRTIRLVFNKTLGFFTTDVEAEAETSIGLSITGDTPTLPPVITPVPPPPPPPPPAPVPTPSGTAFDLWFGVANPVNKIVFSSDAFLGGQPSFNEVLPSPLVGESLVSFGYDYQGNAAYAVGRNGFTDHIYKLTNLAAVRANPATTAVWATILSTGDPFGSGWGNFTQCDGVQMWGSQLLAFCGDSSLHFRVRMVYDGTSWTFVSPANNYVDLLKGITHTYMLRYGAIGGVTYHCPMNIDGSGYFNDPNVSSSDFGLGPWENLINPVAYSFYGKVSHLYVRSWPPSGPVYAMDLPVTGTPLYIKSRIRGAWTGPSIWVVNPNDGQLWFSADGSSFTNAGVNAQWDVNSNDVVMNTSLTGGGTYVWMKNTTAFGTILRYLDPAFAAPAVDRTGNYWTHIQTGGGGFSVVDMYVGYH